MITGQRQREDGTWTFTSVAWDARHYWPIGTRVGVQTVDGLALGTVTKQNSVSVFVKFDTFDGGKLRKLYKDRLLRVDATGAIVETPTNGGAL